MRAGLPWFVAALLVGVHIAASGCSNDEGHEPYASAACTKEPCSSGAVISGGPTGAGSGSGGAEAGVDGAATNLQCFTDPVSLVRLCKASTQCPGVRLDPVNFNNCGFIDSANGLDVECICFGTSLCPVSVQSTCSTIQTIIAAQTADQICAKSPDTCTPLSSVNTTGAGGSGACANSVCAQSCMNEPTCLAGCGC